MSETAPETPVDPPHIHTQTAFMVVVDESGKAFAILEPPPGVAVNYLPDPTAVRRACSEIVDDINAKAAASYVVEWHKAKEREAQAPKPSDAVAEGLKKRGKKGRGILSPKQGPA